MNITTSMLASCYSKYGCFMPNWAKSFFNCLLKMDGCSCIDCSKPFQELFEWTNVDGIVSILPKVGVSAEIKIANLKLLNGNDVIAILPYSISNIAGSTVLNTDFAPYATVGVLYTIQVEIAYSIGDITCIIKYGINVELNGGG